MPDTPTTATSLVKAESVKRQSRQLRGDIAQSLGQPDTAIFSEDDANLLKFHGIYQQYDRDTATERKQRGEDKDHRFMARLRVPAGRLTAEQYLHLDGLAGSLGNDTLRITTRQTIQYHGVLKGDLHALINRINAELLTTFASCGDVVRNVTAGPAPIRDAEHATLDRAAETLSRHLLPRTGAYAEIWVDGEKVRGERVDAGTPVDEPVYGEAYLPRKFKIGIATPEDNAIDVLTNDVGIVALFRREPGAEPVLEGYNICVGGGLGMTHNKPKTYPRLASPLLFVESDGLVGAVEAVVKVQRDHGDRTDRRDRDGGSGQQAAGRGGLRGRNDRGPR